MKRIGIVLTFLALLGLVFAQSQGDSLPADSRFDETVEFSTGVSGETLSVMINALARSIGLTAITDDVPNRVIVYDIGDPKPFRQVWNLVLTLNDLDYILLANDIVVVGTPGSIARLRPPVPGAASSPDVVVAAAPEPSASDDGPPVEQRIYTLSNATASVLAGVLSSAGLGGAEGTGDFRVTADPRTNALIVTGTPAAQARLAVLIPELDRPQRQVNIQVRIQEVVESVAYDLGLDLSGGFGQATASILDTGLNFIFDTAAVVSSFNIMAILDALETQGLSRRVDDSNITVLDNQTGTIQSGGTIFISIPGASENIEREIPYGVQIEVTPRVANDGRVTIVVVARVEDVLSDTGDPAYLELSTRAVTSTISLAPGQTALLGGLLQNNFTVTKQRVPILSAIPIIGELFGSTIHEDRTTDLILVVNALVIE